MTTKLSNNQLKAVLNTVPEHLAVINNLGQIEYVNESWVNFATDNGSANVNWTQFNYFKVCEKSSANGDDIALTVLNGIKAVVNEEIPEYNFNYSCHSPSENRWFTLIVKPLQSEEQGSYVISHHNITKEISYKNDLNIYKNDHVTEIYTRRTFSEFLTEEWTRCMRYGSPISLALIDIDNFKSINDKYGHVFGDLVLKKTASFLSEKVNRPSDMCARYGGDELIVVFGGTRLEDALEIMRSFHARINSAVIEFEQNDFSDIIKVSIGLATMYPAIGVSEFDILKAADRLLYSAKNNHKNNIQFMEYI